MSKRNLNRNQNYEIAFFAGQGKRESQQDKMRIVDSGEEILVVVCDGMGGLTNGEYASFQAIEKYIEQYKAYKEAEGWMCDAIEVVDDIIYKMVDGDGIPLKCGTTLVAAWFVGKQLHWISVGDSRIYLIRGSEMVQITKDHNYFLELRYQLKNGLICQAEYDDRSKMGDALISFVGMGGLRYIDISVQPFLLKTSDIVFLCTDGVYQNVGNEEIVAIIKQRNNMKTTARMIQELIEQKDIPSQDNYTGVLIKRKMEESI